MGQHIKEWWVNMRGIYNVHYKRVAPIVAATMADYGLPYHVQPTFLQALAAHAAMLKKLGRGQLIL
jgi:linoleoyl-CoA desaturase